MMGFRVLIVAYIRPGTAVSASRLSDGLILAGAVLLVAAGWTVAPWAGLALAGLSLVGLGVLFGIAGRGKGRG